MQSLVKFTTIFVMPKQANKLGSNPLMNSVLKQVVGQNANQYDKETAIKQNRSELIRVLIKKLKNLGIKSVTYRFPVEEINEFDLMIMDIQKAFGGKRINKNDVIRTGVNILAEDWRKNKKDSLIYKILEEWLDR